MVLDIGKKIAELRRERNINQEQLAEMANLSRVTIAKYESGRIEPGAQALSRIADALYVSRGFGRFCILMHKSHGEWVTNGQTTLENKRRGGYCRPV